MAREKKPVHKVQMTEGKRNIIRHLLERRVLLSDSMSTSIASNAGAGFTGASDQWVWTSV